MFRLALRNLVGASGRTTSATAGIALLVALSFALAGVSRGFGEEIQATLSMFKGEIQVPAESTGLLTGLTTASSGPPESTPVLYARDVLPSREVDLNLFGVSSDFPVPTKGPAIDLSRGEVVLDASAGVGDGDQIYLSGMRFEVTGIVEGMRMYAGGPVALIRIEDMQELYFSGADVARFFVADGEDPPAAGLRVMPPQEARADLERPVKGATASIDLTRWLLWGMVAAIAFVVQRLSLLDRWVEMAVLRCLGASRRDLLVALVSAGALVGSVGGLVGLVLGVLLGKVFPLAAPQTFGMGLGLVAFTVLMVVAGSAVGLVSIYRVTPGDALRTSK